MAVHVESQYCVFKTVTGKDSSDWGLECFFYRSQVTLIVVISGYHSINKFDMVCLF